MGLQKPLMAACQNKREKPPRSFSQLEKEEMLLKKLSGSINATGAASVPATAAGSSTSRQGSAQSLRSAAETAGDWRQEKPATIISAGDHDGWQTSSNRKSLTASRSSIKRSTGGSRSSEIDNDDNWRR